MKRQLQKQITRTDGHARRVTLPDGGDSGGKDARVDHSARIVELMRENPKMSVSAIVSAIGGGKNLTDPVSDPVTDPVSDPVKIKGLELVKVLADGPRTAAELRGLLEVSHRKFFRDNYINPAIRNGYIVPDEGVSLHNPYLRYFITQRGRDVLKDVKEKV